MGGGGVVLMSVVSLAMLLLELLSPGVETVATLTTCERTRVARLTVNVIEVEFPGPSEAERSQTTLRSDSSLQDQPLPVPETNENPAGSISTTLIPPLAGILPTLVMVNV